MKVRKVLVVLIGVILALFLASQVLAEVPIEGWDKAKFGMSPEEVRSAYAEEEEFFRPDAFWEEQREDKFSHFPYALSTSRMKLLGQKGTVILFFVNDKLFEIILVAGHVKEVTDFMPGVLVGGWQEGKSKGIMTLEERKRKMTEALEQLKLMKEERSKKPWKPDGSGGVREMAAQMTYDLGFDLKQTEERIRNGMKENRPLEVLIDKYGEPSIVEWGDGAIHRWDDEKGNILLLRDYVPLSAHTSDYLRFYSFIITYTCGELLELWARRADALENKWRRVTEKGAEAF
ncbi:hypothetical protein E3J48_04525 [Candidatus Aerophobetes bacterium]|uniref:Uncharacterized protein n=1 Tax=Aerophobetes bacterium TaxID=2030807 RepID=A0A523W5A8_UNCAE|nr:MAG: hypothetical protein E3J48_04525 [Candidatus Aerophobetes bacterium]